ncbi:MAG: PAQR family membrane homeostasis protein TrhA [Alkalilacustris sp.]
MGRDIQGHYTAAERRSDAAVHLAGLSLVALAIPALVVVTMLRRPEPAALWGVGIYGAALAAMIGASALYNMTTGAQMRWLWRRLDHSAIYVKIAGTYTPFTLLTGQGVALTLGLWSAAALGVAFKLASPDRFRWMALGLYLGMGWAGVVAGQAMIAALPGPVVALMLAGGLTYTVGVAFYLWHTLRFHLAIWHVFVLCASLLFYAAVLLTVLLG